uniref:Uncharacterized protein n=1 Tax=Loa loa TaxID=7209 RepID=A0A1I7W2I1_LOALO
MSLQRYHQNGVIKEDYTERENRSNTYVMQRRVAVIAHHMVPQKTLLKLEPRTKRNQFLYITNRIFNSYR